MTDLNVVTLGGRLTKSCELEKKGEVSYVKVSMAVNRDFYNKEKKENVEKTTFVDFAIFGKYAEAMVKHLTKGTYVTIKGYLSMNIWTDKEGKNHQELAVSVEPGQINAWVGTKKEKTDEVSKEANVIAESLTETFSDNQFAIY